MAEGFFDLLEDIFESIFRRPRRERREIPIDFGGVTLLVQPAFFFAEKVTALVKAITGISLLGSVLHGAKWGFTSTGDMVLSLITTPIGVVIASIATTCIALVGIWEFLRPRKKAVVDATKPPTTYRRGDEYNDD